ncbi:hypothetical protein DEI83_06155 [Curtobacterium sp. MCBD17_021]|nr:hypothetical protein DEI83_06155 [Curtobacterium sp. MCBD17_021]
MTVDDVPEDIVRIGGLEFRGGEGFDGFYISPNGLVGWDDSPEVRFDSIDRENGDGEFEAPVYYGARVLTVSGFCYADSSEQLGVYRDRLMGIVANTTRVEVTLHGRTTYGQGAMAAASKFEVDIPGRRAAYQFSRRFPDPYKYGQLHTSDTAVGGGDSVTVLHYGNTWATSLLTITGTDPDGYTIVGPGGRRVDITAPLTANAPHTFDTATGLLRVGGSIRYGALGRADLWRTAAGRPTTVGIGGTSSSTKLVATTRDTYI